MNVDGCAVFIKEEPREYFEDESGREETGEESEISTENKIKDTSVEASIQFVSCGELEDVSSNNDNILSGKVILHNGIHIKEECVIEKEDIQEFGKGLEGNEDTQTENQSFLSDSDSAKNSRTDILVADNGVSDPESQGISEKLDSVDGQTSSDNCRCNICGKVFSQTSSLKRHKLTHSNVRKYTCDICNKSFKRAYVLSNHKLVHSDAKKFTCDVCNKPFSQRSGMVKHKHSHSGVKLYKCDKCDKQFTRKDGLTKHKTRTNCVFRYPCNLCKAAFQCQDELREHYSKTHAGEKKFNCDVCGKGFDRLSIFAEHKLIHDEVKKYVCEVCNKAFAQRGVWSKHRRWVHGNVKNHVCEICNKAFHVFSSLKNHQLTHSDERKFTCLVCSKGFKRQTDLTRHKLSHSDDKNYQCTQCDKKFKFRNGLYQHYLVHSATETNCYSDLQLLGT